MVRVAFAVGISLLIAPFCANGGPAPSEAVAGPRRPLQLPAESVSPGAAQAISAAALAAGGIASAMLLTISAGNRSSGVPGGILTGFVLVFTPSLGRWVAGEISGAATLTSYRLLVGATGAAVSSLVVAPREFNSDSFARYAVAGGFATLLLVQAIHDVSATRRDILLARAVRAYTDAVHETPRGGPGAALDEDKR
jgi:hypothetical protein